MWVGTRHPQDAPSGPIFSDPNLNLQKCHSAHWEGFPAILLRWWRDSFQKGSFNPLKPWYLVLNFTVFSPILHPQQK